MAFLLTARPNCPALVPPWAAYSWSDLGTLRVVNPVLPTGCKDVERGDRAGALVAFAGWTGLGGLRCAP